MSGKTGIIDVGGGLRAVYAAGVLDRCLEEGLTFDLGIGVSAGSGNLASFISGQAGRNVPFYTVYARRREYLSVGNLLRKGSLLNLDYVYGTLSNRGGEAALDFGAFTRNPMDLMVVATDAHTGLPHYFYKQDMQEDRYDVFKASSSLPVVCKPYEVDGVPYYDGALSDPVPIGKAFEWGCDKVVLILSLPESYVRTDKKDRKNAARFRRKYPAAAAALEHRSQIYNRQVAEAKEYAKQGKLLIVAPDDTCGVTTLCRDTDKLNRLNQKGYRDAARIAEFLND